MVEPDMNVLANTCRVYQEVKDGKLIILSLSVYNRALRFQVNGVDADNKSNFRFLFKLGGSHLTFRMIKNAIKKLPSKEVGYEKVFNLYGAKFNEDNTRDVNGKKLNGKVILRKISHKIDGDVNVIQIITPLDVKYSFILKPSQYVEVVENDKKDSAMVSNEFTESFAETIEAILNYMPEAIDKKIEYNPLG